MKLVNVEDLKVLVAIDSKGEIRYGKLVTDLFDDIPTVEAITVEWIERKLAEHWYVDYDIRELLDDWEKENGK